MLPIWSIILSNVRQISLLFFNDYSYSGGYSSPQADTGYAAPGFRIDCKHIDISFQQWRFCARWQLLLSVRGWRVQCELFPLSLSANVVLFDDRKILSVWSRLQYEGMKVFASLKIMIRLLMGTMPHPLVTTLRHKVKPLLSTKAHSSSDKFVHFGTSSHQSGSYAGVQPSRRGRKGRSRQG